MTARSRYALGLAALVVALGASSAHALVMCAKPSRDGTYNSTIMLRETCLRGETQLDPEGRCRSPRASRFGT